MNNGATFPRRQTLLRLTTGAQWRPKRSSYLAHWSCSKGNTSPHLKNDESYNGKRRSTAIAMWLGDKTVSWQRQCQGEQHVCYGPKLWDAYLYIPFFSSFPNGVFHETLEIALLLQTKSRREGKEKLPARMSQTQFMQPSNDLLRYCHGASVRHEMAFYHCFC